MKVTLRKALILLLALVFVGSGAMVIADQIQKRAAEKTYQEAAELVQLPEQLQAESAEETETPEGESVQDSQEEPPVEPEEDEATEDEK